MKSKLYFTFLKQITLASFLLLSFQSAFSQSTDPNDPTSPNYKGKSKAYVKKFSGSAGMSFGTGFNVLSESFGNYNFSGNYSLGKSSITLNAEYNHPLDGNTDDIRQWQFEDLEVVWNAPSLNPVTIKGQVINFAPRLSYRAPVSQTSQYSSTYGALTQTLIASTNLGRFTFIFSPRVTLSYHQFETADKDGFTKNIPFAAILAGAIRATVIKNVYLTVSGFYYNGWDYDSNSVPVNGASGNIYYQVNPKLGLTAFAGWRDRVFTNNALFDSQTSSMGLGVITSF